MFYAEPMIFPGNVVRITWTIEHPDENDSEIYGETGSILIVGSQGQIGEANTDVLNWMKCLIGISEMPEGLRKFDLLVEPEPLIAWRYKETLTIKWKQSEIRILDCAEYISAVRGAAKDIWDEATSTQEIHKHRHFEFLNWYQSDVRQVD